MAPYGFEPSDEGLRAYAYIQQNTSFECAVAHHTIFLRVHLNFCT